ncbi:hypothetical protein ABZ876_00625 [Streptomyces sp. NPDC046931]|uniref:hypothetical protein n=1 Tax=Streptomyces sp. NPDC046931 TaxID=3154806 RepID=UPI0033CDE213
MRHGRALCHPCPEHRAPGTQRSREWLAGAVRITGVVGAPAARGGGVGTRLPDVLLLRALDHRPWTVTGHQDGTALDFFRCRGRGQTAFPPPGERPAPVVLPAPRHPALADACPMP